MIRVQNVTKRYGEFTAVDDVSFTCRPGRVTGFLGPNGAGKTTAMRVMTGLTRPDAGQVLIGGHLYRDIPNPGRHVGVLLDASAQHGGRTGREVLTLGARLMGLPASRADEMLEMVGLSPAEAKRRVKHYSLGMRQRLGLAHAMLGDPSVLVLDEPANGLDPAGIRWMRGLLKEYAGRGGTVLLSSHLLHEVDQIADQMVLIGHGRILAEGDRATLMAGRNQGTHVLATDLGALKEALTKAGLNHTGAGDGLRVDAPPVAVGRAAAENNVVLVDLRPVDGGLEEMFLEMTAGTQREGNPPRPEGGAA